MKKYILSSALALLMMFSVQARAYAQEFCALGSFPAGEEINCYIAQLPIDAEVQAEGLPQGLSLVETEGEDGKYLSLQGMPMQAGRLDFSIKVSEEPELISCSLDIEPASPTLGITGDINCPVGESALIEVTASVSDGGSLSYQWYCGQSPIEGATGASYKPDTSKPGDWVYFCRVTNTNSGLSRAVNSAAVYVTVTEPVIIGISVEHMPEKLIYAPDEKLSTDGLILRADMDNGGSILVDSGFEASPEILSKPGKQLVELRYEGYVCYYEVEVDIAEAAVEGIGVLTLPNKTQYKVGDSLDTRGLVIRAYTAKGHYDISEGLECSPTKLKEAGRQNITVKYADKKCSFTVTVEDDNKLKSIGIASLPVRREYAVGDSVDVSGLSLQLIYDGRTEIINKGFDYSPKKLEREGSQDITVSYEGHTAVFSINVKQAAANPTASPKVSVSPSPTPAGDTASPSPSAAPNVNREHHARELGGFVKVIFALALVSLVGLGGYVFYMQKKGRR